MTVALADRDGRAPAGARDEARPRRRHLGVAATRSTSRRSATESSPSSSPPGSSRSPSGRCAGSRSAGRPAWSRSRSTSSQGTRLRRAASVDDALRGLSPGHGSREQVYGSTTPFGKVAAATACGRSVTRDCPSDVAARDAPSSAWMSRRPTSHSGVPRRLPYRSSDAPDSRSRRSCSSARSEISGM